MLSRVIISGMIGNALEWYEYALYGGFAHIIKQQFNLSEMVLWIIFATGFFVRPLGGVFFGSIGDKLGRKSALALGIITMALPTTGIGLLPSYETIGILAPIILTAFRILQGFSLGGEFSGCIAYIVECSPSNTRGLAGSVAFISMCLGMLLGSATATTMSSMLSPEDLNSWGWRVPFLAGLLMGVLGLYIRLGLQESPIYKAAKDNGSLSPAPIKETLRKFGKEVFIAMSLYISVTGPYYTITVYMQNFIKNLSESYTAQQTGMISVLGLGVLGAVIPFSAYISDKIGRKKVLLCGLLLMFSVVYKVFDMCIGTTYESVITAQLVFSIAAGIYLGPMPTTLVEIFPTRVRFTGVGLSYNISAALFGGTIPAVATFLHGYTGSQHALSFYLMLLIAYTTFIVLKMFKESYRKPIHDKELYGKS